MMDLSNYKKVNLGCGVHRLEGYLNVDLYRDCDLRADAADLCMIPDSCFEEVYASHLLEHFPRARTQLVLKEWRRILQPGGKLVVRVPDFRWGAERFVEGTMSSDQFARRVFAYEGLAEGHKWMWDEESLRSELKRAKFRDIVRIPGVGKEVATLTLHARKRPKTQIAGSDLKIGLCAINEMPMDGYDSICKIITNTIPYYKNAGAEVHVFSAKVDYPEYDFIDGIHYHRAAMKSYARYVCAKANELGLDIVEVYNRPWCFSCTARSMVHMSNAHFKAAHAEAIRDADRVTVISQYCYERTVDTLPYFKRITRINKLGVDLSLFKPSAKNQRPTLLHLGLVSKAKGILYFVRAANKLLEEVPDLDVIVAGPEGHAGVFESLHKIADPRVRFLGELEPQEVPVYMAGADVLLAAMDFPYTWSLAVMEAQAAGTAVIVSAKGGLPETIIDGKTGFVVTGLDEIVGRARFLLTHRDVAKSMGLEARVFASDYGWETTASRQLQAYQEVLAA